MRMRVGTVAAVLLLGPGVVSVGKPVSAAPIHGVIAGAADISIVSEARYVRRHGRTCYRKCYREFVIGRRVCRTYCGPF